MEFIRVVPTSSHVHVVFKVRTCVTEEVNTARLKVKIDSLEQCIYNNYVFPLVVLNYSYMYKLTLNRV